MYLTFIFENLFPFIYNAFLLRLRFLVSETGKSYWGEGGGLAKQKQINSGVWEKDKNWDAVHANANLIQFHFVWKGMMKSMKILERWEIKKRS